MGGGKSQIEQPAPVRMPNSTDPDTLAAQTRFVDAAKARGGRRSTILSDMLKGPNLNGASGLAGR